ncbi:MAG: hypothetical protein V2A58_10985 [Planctomycetota bacterium]
MAAHPSLCELAVACGMEWPSIVASTGEGLWLGVQRPFATSSGTTGVEMAEDMGYMPCVRDKSNRLVPIFHVFAVMEETSDFAEMCDSLAELSAGAVEEAIRYISDRLQGNTAGLDIENLIEEHGYGHVLFGKIRELIAQARPDIAPFLQLSTTGCTSSVESGALLVEAEDADDSWAAR